MPRNQRSVQRKLQEILIAYAVSRPHSGFTKNDILSLYLNTVFFGHQAYGVEGLQRALKATNNASIEEALDHLFKSSHEFTRGSGRHDDTSVVLLERQ